MCWLPSTLIFNRFLRFNCNVFYIITDLVARDGTPEVFLTSCALTAYYAFYDRVCHIWGTPKAILNVLKISCIIFFFFFPLISSLFSYFLACNWTENWSKYMILVSLQHMFVRQAVIIHIERGRDLHIFGLSLCAAFWKEYGVSLLFENSLLKRIALSPFY